MTVNPDYYKAIAAGTADMIFSTWGGAPYNGMGILSNVYCDDPKGGGNQNEYGFDTSAISVSMELDVEGTLEYTEYRASLKNWADWLNNPRRDHQIRGRKKDAARGKLAEHRLQDSRLRQNGEHLPFLFHRHSPLLQKRSLPALRKSQ